MKIILVYVPVIHIGYVDFFARHQDASDIYLWGWSMINSEKALAKEIRDIGPDYAQIALGGLLGRSDIKIAETQMLPSIVLAAMPLVMPDDGISRSLVEHVLTPLGLKSYTFDRTFLRWESQRIGQAIEVAPDEIKPFNTLKNVRKVIEQAHALAAQSSDWWRQVGAVIFDQSDEVLGFARNHHLPTDYTPYIDGDPRAAFSKGKHIELTTAVHAEASLLAASAREGIKTEGLRMFVTTFPCPVCAKFIALSGISEIWYCEGYAMLDGERVLRDAGVKIVQIK